MSAGSVLFTEVVRDVSGGNVKIPQSEYQAAGMLPVVDQGKGFVAGFTDDECYAFRSETLPVVVFGDHTRAVKYIDFPFAMGADGVKVLKPTGECDAKFLYHYLRQARIPDAGYSRHYKFLKELRLTLPPLAEQRRIAAILDKADALLANRREAIAKLDQLLQSVFLDMFGDPVANPMGWECLSLDEATANLRRGPFGGALKKEIFVRSGYWVYEQQHAIYGDFSSARYFIDEEKYAEMKDFAVLPGDLIVSCSGTMGRVSVAPSNAPDGVINQALLRIRPNRKIVQGEFLADILRSDRMQTHLFGISRGSGLKNFPPMSDLRELRMITPPIELQDRYLGVKSKILGIHNKLSADVLGRLFLALQQAAFSGGL